MGNTDSYGMHCEMLKESVKCKMFIFVLGFTLLALDMPGSAPQKLQPHPIQSIMQSFGWDEMLHPLLVTHYLNHLLQNGLVSLPHLLLTLVWFATVFLDLALFFHRELVSWVSSGPGSGSAQALCVRAWMRCVLQQYLHKSQEAPDSRAGNRAFAGLLSTGNKPSGLDLGHLYWRMVPQLWIL